MFMTTFIKLVWMTGFSESVPFSLTVFIRKKTKQNKKQNKNKKKQAPAFLFILQITYYIPGHFLAVPMEKITIIL